ncbi:alpha/beta fold hydrolase [Ottowia sp. VDI28]|uniref:alpha/beta fold hydrolase n=1 Tax=Ottowia sp. VDI28 TaxID=3133968 RepID=UPI003C3032C7
MVSTRKPWRMGEWLLSAVVISGLVACGGSDGSDPLQPYREQTVQWTECDATILGMANTTFDELKGSDRLRCGYIRAPLDWANAERGDVSIAVMRLAAAKPENRRGALVFNPGGPGTDGLSLSLRLFAAFAKSNPESPQGAEQLRLLDEYDMVGFSPRGVGASTRLDCATNELTRFVDETPSGWNTPESLENIEYNNGKLAEACRKNPVTPYINTDATARDMDLMRGLLGDEKLNYVGYSYGTWLGAWYASLFPEKVGRMVLDSAADFSTTFEAAALTPQPVARQRLFDELLSAYAVRHADYFHLGENQAQVQAIFPSLSEKMQAVLGRPLSGLGYFRKDADSYLNAVAAGKGLDAVLKNVPDPADEDAVEKGLDEYVFDPVSAVRDEELREYAGATLYAIYEHLWLNPAFSSVALNPAGGQAVRCNDTPWSTDWTAWSGVIRDAAQRAPLFFSTLLDQRVCGLWGGPSVKKPDFAPMKPLDILFLQSEFDSATYTGGANAFFAQLPGAHRVYVPGDYQHGVFPYQDACVDPLVTSYLLGKPVPSREAICQAKPMPQDAENSSAGAKSTQSGAGGAVPVYNDPEEAGKLIDEFKQGLIQPESGS